MASTLALTLPDAGQRALILVAAILLDAIFGDPDWLWKRARHPVAVMGGVIGWCDKTFNREDMTAERRRFAGVAVLAALVLLTALLAQLVNALLGTTLPGLFIETIIVAILLAGRSLHDHVKNVAGALEDKGITAGRHAVSMIVGRDPEHLDENGVARAAIESSAENFADGLVAPAFWFLAGGLPLVVLCKLVNTADSMIGHKTARHREFGWAAARLDDVANYLPARLSGLLIAIGGASAGHSFGASISAMGRDAHKHASPNAGWPESAMAGAMDIALAGPRIYAEYTSRDAWLNPSGRKKICSDDISTALRILVAASVALVALVFIIGLWQAIA